MTIGLLVKLNRFRLTELLCQRSVDCCQNPTGHGDEMWSEDDTDRSLSNAGEFLFDLGNMIVSRDTICTHVLVRLGKTKTAAATATGTGNAGFSINHDAGCLHDSCTQ